MKRKNKQKPADANCPAVSDRTARAVRIMADFTKVFDAFYSWVEEEHGIGASKADIDEMNSLYDAWCSFTSRCDPFIKEQMIRDFYDSVGARV